MAWEDELELLARERGPALVGYAYLLTGELHAAQDLVQEGLVRTFSRRRSGADIAWLEAYVRQAILNAYLNTYRRGRRWDDVVHLVVEPDIGRPPDEIAAERTDVHSALARLSPRERACIVLRHFEDLTVPEIADRLALREGTVKRYLSDARGRLGPLLEPSDAAETEILNEGAGR